MPTFTYKARDQKGELIQGTIDAESKGMVTTRLQTMGFFPVEIFADEKGREGKFSIGRFLKGKIRTSDLSTFNRQLADMISAGVPLVRSLGVILNQTASESLKEILQAVNNDVSAGDTLAKALSRHPRVFSKLYCAMVKAGETGGMLDGVLQRLADFSEEEETIKGKIKGALAYPIIMIFAGSAAIFVLMTVVIPKIVNVFAELHQALPLPTQILIKITNFLIGSWWMIILGGVFLFTVVWRYFKTAEGRKFFHRTQIQIPILGDLIIKREVSRFARTLGSLLRNGVSILNALEITEEVIGNAIVNEEVKKISENITQGSSVAGPLKGSKVFPPVVVNMMSIGEETGKLDEVLLKIASSYEIEVDRSVKLLTSMIEPLIILMMGFIVGFIVISMMLPIFNLDPTV